MCCVRNDGGQLFIRIMDVEEKIIENDYLVWQKENSDYVKYMEIGQYIVPVNNAMYAKLKYTPWVDFPPQESHPLDDWHDIFRSFD